MPPAARSFLPFTFSEDVTGFTVDDITVTGGTKGTFTDLGGGVYTLAVTPTANTNAGLITVTVADGAATDAGGNDIVGASASQAYDTANPTVVIDIVDTALSDTDNNSLVTFAFSEAPVGFTLGDISPTHGTMSNLIMVDATHYTAVFTADDGFEGQGSVTVDAAKFTDAALNANEAATPDTVTIDTANPTVVIDIVDTALSDTDNNSLVTFAFSEAPVGFTLGDISPTHGTMSNLIMVDATHYTAVFTADDGFEGQGSVTVDAAKFTDAALNANEAATPDTVTIDTLNPTVVIDIVDTALSDTDNNSLVTFAFSEAPVGFTLGDISPTHGTMSNLIMVDATHYTAVFTADDGFEGQGSVTVDAAKFTDAALNANEAATPDTVTIDTANPTVVIDIVDTALSDTDNNSLVTFAFSEAPVGFTLGDISPTHGTMSNLIMVDATHYTAVFTADDGFEGQGSVTVDAAKFTDAALNANEAATPDTVTIDTANPTVVIDIVDTALSDTDNNSLVTFAFSEAPVGFTLGDISPTHGTMSNLIMVDATHYTAVFTADDGFEGQGSVTVDAAKFTDAALNANEAATPDTVTIDTLNPTVVIDIVDTALSDTDNNSLVTFAFSEAPVGFTLGDISPTHGTMSDLIMVDATHYTAVFTADDGFEGQGSVTVDAAKFTDAALNANEAATPDTVTIDTLNPTVVIDIVDTALSDTDNSSLVTFAFSEAPVGFDAGRHQPDPRHDERPHHGRRDPTIRRCSRPTTASRARAR